MKRSLCVLFSLFLTCSALATSPGISYVLGMSRPASHIFEVDVVLDGLDSSASSLELILPVWRPGRYVVLDLANGVIEFNASDGVRNELQWKKIDKATWRIETKGVTKVHARYKVYANEFHLRTRGLNDERAFVDGSAVFMYAERYRWLPVTLTVVPFGDWHVTTALDTVQGKPNTFTAPHYDYFVDCPLEIGTQKDFTFSIEGKEHVLSVGGKGNYNPDSLVRDISTIVRSISAFWDGLPYQRYVFLLSLTSTGGGGTEHINSTAMSSRPFIFKNPDSYLGFLSLVSHEFFHTWNVKRLRPAGLSTYNWTRENYTEELWVAEGTSSYYDDLLLVRAGLMTETQYLGKLSSAIEADRGRPGNLKQSLADCSYDAWIKYWKWGRGSFNHETDYYARGAAVSFALDMTIRQRTKNKRSLDDVLRLMYRRFPLGKGGYTNADFRKTCEEVSGSNLQQFFNDYVNGAKQLPWDEMLSVAGLELSEKHPEKKPWLGISSNDDRERLRVTSVTEGSPAYDAGINHDDEIIALNGHRVTSRELQTRIAELQEGESVRLTVFRDDRLRTFDVVLRYPVFVPHRVEKVSKPDALQKAVLHSWLQQEDEKGEKR